MRIHGVSLIIVLLVSLGLTGCGPSYPKSGISASVEKMILQEYKLRGKARLVGKTLYLEVQVPGMLSTDPKALTSLLTKVQNAFLSVTRVALSSDAQIDYMAVIARDPSLALNLQLVQRLDDVKSYFYQRISHADYEERLVLEINTHPTLASLEQGSFLARAQEIGAREFLGRLIVSQINMLSRSNPFLSVILGNAQLRLDSLTDDAIIMKLDAPLSEKSLPLFEEIVKQKAKKTIGKMDLWQPKVIKVLGPDDRQIVASALQ